MSDSNVSRLYDSLRRMAAEFELKPDERINESALAVRLGASRTPLREALNRLVAEGFLTFQSGRGFFNRSLSPTLVLELYEARVAVETETARLATERATPDRLAGLKAHLDRDAAEYSASEDATRLLDMDEAFHLAIADLSGNRELKRMVENLNHRVRYIRRLFMQRMIEESPPDTRTLPHRAILAAIASGDGAAAAQEMRGHIERRRGEAAEAVRNAYSRLYVPEQERI